MFYLSLFCFYISGSLFWGLCFYTTSSRALTHWLRFRMFSAPCGSSWASRKRDLATIQPPQLPIFGGLKHVETVDGRTSAPVDSLSHVYPMFIPCLSHVYPFFMGLQLVPSKVVQDFFHPPPIFPPCSTSGWNGYEFPSGRYAAFVGAGARSVCCTFSHPSWSPKGSGMVCVFDMGDPFPLILNHPPNIEHIRLGCEASP